MKVWTLKMGVCAAALLLAAPAVAQAAGQPWMNRKLSPDARADLVLAKLSLDQQIALLHGSMPVFMGAKKPANVQISAGWLPGVPELNIPDLTESDASLGVASAGRKDDDATPLPSGLALAATWDPKTAYASGAMIGKEARQKGFNTLLAGGVNLLRDPRNGRNFEYLGEDPLLAGTLDGASIAGIQSNHIVSTIKHFALNDQETGRMVLDGQIDEAAFRESDLLAFEIAIEAGHPGSVMCAYNRVGGTYACENPFLLTDVLRKDWNYPGWVMSDWGAVHGVAAAKAGLDQESGQQLDKQVFFDAPLKAAVASGEVSKARIHEMAHRYLRSLFAAGAVDHPVVAGGLDTAADGLVAGRAEEQAIVLLKNDTNLLPLMKTAKKIAVIGGHADIGVISGGGSSQVIPPGSITYPKPKGAPQWGGGQVYTPDAPLKAIAARAGGAQVAFNDGADPASAAALAKASDVVVVFATQWSTEGMDIAMKLDGDQDRLIAAVAAANPRTVVVLETAGPVAMPWRDRTAAILEAWFPGARGADAIAKVLFGEVDPQGRLPVSFPASEAQLARPVLPGSDQDAVETLTPGAGPKPFDVRYTEGSNVGYRGYAKSGEKPLYPFGYGLSYTVFRYSGLKVTGGKTLTASFTVANVSNVAGTDTPQVYLTAGPKRTQQRLIGWSKVALKPGEARVVTVTAPARMLANWDAGAHGWKVDGGAYKVTVGPDAATVALKGSATVAAAKLKP
ncbi:beta-glucosidase [Phenylobacterium sp.]|uniref:beta-glucosidase n=1 Tax=Phenylobacterium sp. TaxID=1871053 RepID=UPI002CB97A48|nr:beta-glucosidase [Phenylobacterium sp.]HLZ77393.1 beta-glucosidase [Phenylobacterium sp.]